jgi:large subunit ribosomal protein L28
MLCSYWYKSRPKCKKHIQVNNKKREMAKVCEVTGKRTTSGNNVSHANNRTRRKFFPNLHMHRIWVESQNKYIKLRLSKKGLRTIDKLGIDHVLTNLKDFGEKA